MTALAGLANLDKPAGITSHKAVQKLRRILSVKRIGHGGTLDPLATGVLPILVGDATRLMEFVAAAEKRYLATVHLGVVTDTQDAEGQVVAARPFPDNLSTESVTSHARAFVGHILQAVPAYSAVRHGGRRLYDMARNGESVQVPPRKVHIASIELVEFSPPEIVLDIVCGKGTYIRQLASDLGERIGCGAHLAALRRTRVGDLHADNAVTLEQVAKAVSAGETRKVLMPMRAAACGLPSAQVDRQNAERLAMGQRIPAEILCAEAGVPATVPSDQPVAVLLSNGALVAVVRVSNGQAQPLKVFPSQVGTPSRRP